MPGLPSPTGNPYPTIECVMNVARARVNDMMNDTAGDLLADDVPASQVYLTAAWKWLQRRCTTAGVETFLKEITIYSLPVQATNDVANQAWITWLGCSDGVNQYELPRLPQDMIHPLSVWQRLSLGANPDGSFSQNSSPFYLMVQAQDGLPRWLDYNVYDWRSDGMYFYAPTWLRDLQIRYSAYRQELSLATNSPTDTPATRTVPIMMCEDCLGSRIAFEFANARGSAQAPAMEAWADKAFETITLGSTQRKMRRSTRRKPYSRRGRNFGPYPYLQNN